jgi:ABC-type transport system involved in multi-copper enzyme maturation permease subunit
MVVLPAPRLTAPSRRNELGLPEMWTLYSEELRSVTRGRFALLGTAVVLLGLGGLAAVASQDTWLDSYGVIAYFLVPLGFLPMTAGMLATPRANRFVESLFTAPVSRSNWLAARLLVVLTLALAYYLALIPTMLVFVGHVGMPYLLGRFLLWAPGILLISIAVGSLVGVVFIGRSVAAPVATAVGLMLIFAVLVPLQELLVARGYGASASGHFVLLSPLVLLKNALGFTLAVGTLPATTTATWICFAVVLLGALALAAWVFLKLQGVESWEASRGQRWILAGIVVLLILIPIAQSDTDYTLAAPAPNNAPDIPGLFLRGGGNLALVDPGQPAPARCCDTLLNRDQWPTFPTDIATKQDLLIFLPVDARSTVATLQVQLTGQSGLDVAADPGAVAQAAGHLEKYDYPAGQGPMAPDGRRIASGWIARIPIAFTPTKPWDLGGVRYPLDINVTYTLAGDDGQPKAVTMRGAIEAHISTAIYEMSAAGAFFPLLCLLAGFRRWRRTR